MAKIVPYTAGRRCLISLLCLSISLTAAAQGRDIRWLRDIYHNRNASLSGTMKFVSDTYIPLNAAVPLAQLVYGYAAHDKSTIQNGWQTAGSIVITAVLTEGAKYVIDRKRPYETYSDIIPYKYEMDASMPSGHTSVCFSTATSLSLEYPRWYVIAPSYLYACTVAYSRLYLGEHYPSDIIVGALTGAGSAFISYEGMKWLQHRKHKKHDPAQ